MNWGYKIVVVFVLFVAGIVTLVIKSSMQDHDLVTSGYYEKELVYQQRIDALNNVAALKDTVVYNINDRKLTIFFPEQHRNGKVDAKVHWYSPSDAKRDIEFDHVTEEGVIVRDLGAMEPGWYYVKLEWAFDGNTFYEEKKLELK